ncbi:hypothetical protein PITC_060210 [Penicillium italicum]|uniref:Uncharacterized protein n=1 Tax=Penicillium italicum TaxID=40296 RepID=A0A0A2LNE7_PENIT|nr:hypothetical protein PITC_060210 [Penicillium italicum]
MASSREPLMFPTLAVEDPQFKDVETIFHLTQATNTDWEQFRVSFEIPDDCKSTFDMLDTSVSQSDGKHVIALRLRLCMIIGVVHSTPPDPLSSHLARIPISPKCRFSFEPAIYKGKKHCLRGFPDWSLWYSPFEMKTDVAVNFVIVEAETKQVAHSTAQTLAYMGMIHAQRRYEGKADCTVFGLSTDNEQFHFIRINSNGEWCQLNRNYSDHFQEIVETLAYIHKCASALSVSDHGHTSENARVEDGPATTKGSGKGSSSDKTWSVFHVEDNLHAFKASDDSDDNS